jgi:hypothetical protein
MRRPLASALACLLLAACASSPTPRSGDSRGFDYLQPLSRAEAHLSAPDVKADEAKRGLALTQLALVRSWVGDSHGADAAIAEHNAWRLRYSEPFLERLLNDQAKDLLVRFRVEDAVEAVVREARERQVVIINESRHRSRNRAFTLAVALELRKLGFEYLAVDGLDDGAGLARRGYPVVGDGYYTREPMYGDLLRQALAAGYRPVAYRHPYSPGEPGNVREERMAQTLVDRIFKENPRARVLVHASSAQIWKAPLYTSADPDRVRWLAEQLREKTGIDPLCVDQVLAEDRDPQRFRIIVTRIFADSPLASVVLRDVEQPHSYWRDQDAIDMQVVHRPERQENGRPDWLALGGRRSPHPIPAKLLPASGRRLVQAFVARESRDAVPIDQVLVTAGEIPPVLMLPEGRIRYEFED